MRQWDASNSDLGDLCLPLTGMFEVVIRPHGPVVSPSQAYLMAPLATRQPPDSSWLSPMAADGLSAHFPASYPRSYLLASIASGATILTCLNYLKRFNVANKSPSRLLVPFR